MNKKFVACVLPLLLGGCVTGGQSGKLISQRRVNIDKLAKTLACQLEDTWKELSQTPVSDTANPIANRFARVSIGLVDNLNNSLGATAGFQGLKFGNHASSTLSVKSEVLYADQAEASFAFDIHKDDAHKKCSDKRDLYAMANFGLADWAKNFNESQVTFPSSAAALKFVRTATLTVVDGTLGFSFGAPVSFGPSFMLKSTQQTKITIEFLLPPPPAKKPAAKPSAKPKLPAPRQIVTPAVDALLKEIERQKAAKALSDALKADPAL